MCMNTISTCPWDENEKSQHHQHIKWWSSQGQEKEACSYMKGGQEVNKWTTITTTKVQMDSTPPEKERSRSCSIFSCLLSLSWSCVPTGKTEWTTEVQNTWAMKKCTFALSRSTDQSEKEWRVGTNRAVSDNLPFSPLWFIPLRSKTSSPKLA